MPTFDGLAADGLLLAPDYVAGHCHEATREADGTWTPCSCPGWYPEHTAHQLRLSTARAARMRRQHPELEHAPELDPQLSLF